MQAQESISADLAQIKFILYGDGEHPVNPDHVNQFYDAFQAAEVMGPLIGHIAKYDFEVRLRLCCLLTRF